MRKTKSVSDYIAVVYRKTFSAISSFDSNMHKLEGMTIHGDSPEAISKECYEFSRESNGSELRPDQRLFFMILHKDTPMAYGSPGRTQLIWRESHFLQ